jgi:hypothetical protein
LEEFCKIKRKKERKKAFESSFMEKIGEIELKMNKFLKKEYIYNISYVNILFLE